MLLRSKKYFLIFHGLENSADCRTRDMLPLELLNCELWFNGPQRLRESLNDKLSNELFEDKYIQDIVLKEEKKIVF